MVLIKSDNILTPHSLKKVRNILDRYTDIFRQYYQYLLQMYDVHQSIEAIRVDNKTFQDICTK